MPQSKYFGSGSLSASMNTASKPGGRVGKTSSAEPSMRRTRPCRRATSNASRAGRARPAPPLLRSVDVVGGWAVEPPDGGEPRLLVCMHEQVIGHAHDRRWALPPHQNMELRFRVILVPGGRGIGLDRSNAGL